MRYLHTFRCCLLFQAIMWMGMAKPPLHPFKMSVCEVVYMSQPRHFEVKCYLFQDDLRETLYADPLNGALTADKVGPYLREHLALGVNGQAQTLQLREVRLKEEQILVRFETGSIPPGNIKQVSVDNRILLEKFDKQVNMVYLYYPNEQSKRTKAFDKQHQQEVFIVE